MLALRDWLSRDFLASDGVLDQITIRGFKEADADQVRALFTKVNRSLAPPSLSERMDAYIVQSLREEIDRISDYYGAKGGSFWVAVSNDRIVGMFGLEPSSPDTMELRRMYVDPDCRRQGIA